MDLHFSHYERIVFFTGAGMSAESGVPTYRGAGGIWKEYDYNSYACQDAFDRDPQKVWDFHNYRRGLVGACSPNAGHALIAKLEKVKDVVVVTQNIDGLHQQAGSERVYELHGSLWKLRCDSCGATSETRDAPLAEVKCSCGAWWRPAITWFGDGLDHAVFEAAAEALSKADICVAIGTSGVVYPAASLPAIAQRAGAKMVEANPEETAISDLFEIHLRESASTALVPLAEGLV